MDNNNIQQALEALLGHNNVLFDDGARRDRSHDFWLLDFQRRLHGTEAPAPVCVVRPQNADHVSAVLRFANTNSIPVVPYGLGSGVCGGARGNSAAIVLDMSEMAHVLQLNEKSLTVTVEPGLRGSALEDYLNLCGYSMGHFPQSMRLSSVGGWVATRASGQYSTKYGNIEDMLVCVEGVLADGTPFSTGNTPRTSTGPSVNQLVLGSEGTLCVLTKLTFKIHPLPEAQYMGAFQFDTFAAGLDAIRLMTRAGLKPALVRLYDASESKRHFGRAVARGKCVLLLLCEGNAVVARAEQDECQRIAGQHGKWLGTQLVEHWLEHRFEIADISDLATRKGVVFDTIEVAANWDRIEYVYNEAIAALKRVPGMLNASAHSSHSYQQGTCLYFTFAAKKPRWVRKQVERLLFGSSAAFTAPEDLPAVEKLYEDSWKAVMEAVINNGGTISHHHGIGKVRLPWLERELGSSLYILRAIKRALDPAAILNPGSLFNDR